MPVLLTLGLAGCAAAPPAWPRQPMPMVSLASVCMHQPNELSEWFPRHHLKRPLRKSIADDPAAVERSVAPSRCVAGGVLRSFDEPALGDGTHTEALRVILMPSFRPPTVIRLERFGSRIVAVIKVDRGGAEALTGAYWTQERELSEADFAAAIAATERANCWGAQHTCSAEVGVEPDVVYVDGETWLLEGARGDVHWGVEVDGPPDGPFREAVQAVLRAAGAETDRRR